jgi:hypothetical protein
MTRRWFLALVSAALSLRIPGVSWIWTQTRDGSSPERAILEDAWVWCRRELPGWTLALQMLMRGPNNTRVNRYLFKSPSGDWLREVFFEVTHHFTHMRPNGNGRSLLEHYRTIQFIYGDDWLRTDLAFDRRQTSADRRLSAGKRCERLQMLELIERELLGA